MTAANYCLDGCALYWEAYSNSISKFEYTYDTQCSNQCGLNLMTLATYESILATFGG